MYANLETLQRSSVAFVGALVATLVLIVASAPNVPIA